MSGPAPAFAKKPSEPVTKLVRLSDREIKNRIAIAFRRAVDETVRSLEREGRLPEGISSSKLKRTLAGQNGQIVPVIFSIVKAGVRGDPNAVEATSFLRFHESDLGHVMNVLIENLQREIGVPLPEGGFDRKKDYTPVPFDSASVPRGHFPLVFYEGRNEGEILVKWAPWIALGTTEARKDDNRKLKLGDYVPTRMDKTTG